MYITDPLLWACQPPLTDTDIDPFTAPACKMSGLKVSKCLTSTETIGLIRDREKGVWRWGGGGKRESIYTYRYTVKTRMTCIKMGSDESHFNVSLIVRDN